MEPNFHDGEYILTDKISYRFRNPERGQVIIFKAPKNPDIDYIKRIIGLPGETVKVHEGFIYINGNKLPEPYLRDQTTILGNGFLSEDQEITVPEEEFFVMGDNRPHSSDSREFGPIPKNSIIGKAFIRYWPLSDLGMIKKQDY